MAIRMPTIAPRAPTVRAPQVTLPGGNLVSGFMSQKPAAQMPTMQNLKPMPDSVKNNINLGWNYATGQVVQPLTPQQRAQVAIPPIGNLGIKIPTQTVMPVVPQQIRPPMPFPGQQNMLISQFLPKAAPVAPVKPRIR